MKSFSEIGKRIFVVILCAFFLFIVGCNEDEFGGGDVSGRVHDQNYYSGTNGLEIEFVEGQPPRTIFENQEVPVAVKVSNKGVADAYDVKMLLFYQDLYFGMRDGEGNVRELVGAVSGDAAESSLLGINEYNPIGDETSEYFTLKSHPFVTKKESVSTDVKAIVCYKYYTKATAQLCVDPNVGSVLRKSVCDANQDIPLSGGQGSPVSVTRVQQITSANDRDEFDVSVLIFVRNDGDGKVVDVDSEFEECLPGAAAIATLLDDKEVSATTKTAPRKRDGVVDITEVRTSAGSKRGSCNRVEVKLDQNKEASFSCKLRLRKQDAGYTTPLTIELDYGYVTAAKAPIDIQRLEKDPLASRVRQLPATRTTTTVDSP